MLVQLLSKIHLYKFRTALLHLQQFTAQNNYCRSPPGFKFVSEFKVIFSDYIFPFTTPLKHLKDRITDTNVLPFEAAKITA